MTSTCEPLEHDWEVESIIGKDYNEEVALKFRCRKCHASLEGEIIR